MSHRLQVLVPDELDKRIRLVAKRERLSKGEWVRRAIRKSLRDRALDGEGGGDPVSRLASLEGPTADIEDMLQEVESGRR